MFIVGDGKGRGNKAGVNNNGQLETLAVSLDQMAHESKINKTAFEIHPPRFTIPAGLDTNLVYIKNTSADKDFHIRRIRLWWNGGDTNHNRAAIVRFKVNPTVPTANAVTGRYGSGDIPHNMNLGSNLEPELDLQYWDKTGSPAGMAVANEGEQLWCSFLSQGYTSVDFEGALIVPPGFSFLFTAEPEEDGQTIIVTSGFFLPHQG